MTQKKLISNFISSVVKFPQSISIFLIAVLTVGMVLSLHSQSKKNHSSVSSQEERAKLQMRRSELEKIKADILSLERELAGRTKKEKATIEYLDITLHRRAKLEEMLSKLRRQAGELTQNISATQARLRETQSDYDRLKNEYARIAVAVYKHRAPNVWALVTSAGSVNQAVARSALFHSFSRERERTFTSLEETSKTLEETKSLLGDQLHAKATVITQTHEEELVVRRAAAENKKTLSQIRRDKTKLRAELSRRNSMAKKLEGIISALVTHSNQSRDRGEAPAVKNPAPRFTKGILSWPISSRKVVNTFGEKINPKLGTVTTNLGIDIAAGIGTPVVASARGVVSIVTYLPSYGTIVIIDHGNGYRTVYANLASVSVEEGEAVKEGEPIAVAGESVSIGAGLHFEVWHEREKQDPLALLK